ncbi:hypothetical protein HMPREF9088_0311 [Enterococcus italicus DSM 15952]|uniref:Uncharacterized protein n=1 Tax=Enterococcus italicus (strain DSM 15952 / CCUG 50447 / LMG 22039 / TP 1.5) TaxID=888064 RepID=E6LD71_ENTI1|nr:hypothetical protein HMPREF9088_0311 [Enterococcus italicus DSM 15952]
MYCAGFLSFFRLRTGWLHVRNLVKRASPYNEYFHKMYKNNAKNSKIDLLDRVDYFGFYVLEKQDDLPEIHRMKEGPA